MSFSHQVTFQCDGCGLHFTIDEDNMELPPSWLAMQIVIADSEGCVPDHEREVFCHFCSQDCLVEYTASDDMRHRLAMADRDEMDDESDLGETGEEV